MEDGIDAQVIKDDRRETGLRTDDIEPMDRWNHGDSDELEDEQEDEELAVEDAVEM